MKTKANNFDIVVLATGGTGVVVDTNVDFVSNTPVPLYTIFRHDTKEYVNVHDDDFQVKGMMRMPFKWGDHVEIHDAHGFHHRIGTVDGISWNPETQEWWFSVRPRNAQETEMFSVNELHPISRTGKLSR
jgi:hypothetical protein